MIAILCLLLGISIPLFAVSKLFLGYVSLPDIIIILLCLSAFLNVLYKKKKLSSLICRPPIAAIYLYVVFSILSYIYNKSHFSSFDEILRIFEYSLLYVVILYTSQSPMWLERIVTGLWIGFLMVIVSTLIHYILGPGNDLFVQWGPVWAKYYTRSNFRIYGLLDNPLNLCAYLAFFFGVVVSVVDADRGKLNLAIMLTLGVTIISLLLSGSFSACVALMISLLFLLRRRIVIAVGLVILTTFLLWSGITDTVLNRYFDTALGSTFLQRTYVYKSTLKIILDNPLLGVGPGNFGDAYYQNYTIWGASTEESSFTAENIFLETYANLGLVPFVCLLYILGRATFLTKKGRSRPAISVWGFSATSIRNGIVLYLLIGMIQSLSSVPLNMTLFTVLAIHENMQHGKEGILAGKNGQSMGLKG